MNDSPLPLPRRHEFVVREDEVYLCGHSLGLMPVKAGEAVEAVVNDWRDLAVRGWTASQSDQAVWNAGWFQLTARLQEPMARLVGGQPEDIVFSGSVTSLLHQFLMTLCGEMGRGLTFVVESEAFPTDRYAMESTARILAGRLEQLPDAERSDGTPASPADRMLRWQPQGPGLLLVSAVSFDRSERCDLHAVVAAARRLGYLIGLDCSHAVGVCPLDLSDIDADFAVWCTYKYLHGGPGAVAAGWMNPRHADRLPGLAGWFGCDPTRQFEMCREFIPAAGAARLQQGTPHILSTAPLTVSLPLLAEAGISSLRQRSLQLTARLIEGADRLAANFPISVASPRDANRRGGHVALRHPEAKRLSTALRSRGVIGDFRHPDILRLAPAPMVTTDNECDRAFSLLEEILQQPPETEAISSALVH